MIQSGGLLGLFIAMFPTCAMLLASLLLANITVESDIEACFQNFSAGLMLAAVAGELFPLVLNDNPDIEGDTKDIRSIGVGIGFVLGFALIHGVEYIISSYEEEADVEAALASQAQAQAAAMAERENSQDGGDLCKECVTKPGTANSMVLASSVNPVLTSEGVGTGIGAGDEMDILPTDETVTAIEAGESNGNGSADSTPSKKSKGMEPPMDKARYEGLYEPQPVLVSHKAIQKQSHREHITVHLRELMDSIAVMKLNTDRLLLTRGTPTPTLGTSSTTPTPTVSGGGTIAGGDEEKPHQRSLSVSSTSPLDPASRACHMAHQHSSGNGRSDSGFGPEEHHPYTSNPHHPHTPHLPRVHSDALCYVRHEEAEQLAETIDEEIHKLQYKLDHCRRLLQGSECGVFHGPSWLNSEKLEGVKGHINELGESVEHLLAHMAAGEFDVHVLQEIYTHMDDMDNQLMSFHDTISEHSNKWRRHKFPEVVTGESIPTGLVIPVCIDSFIDGFLIGITVAVAYKAGLILAVANCLEMSFLGMAYTTRVMKCTGSTVNARILTIVSAPLMMLAAAGLGGEIGLMSESNPLAFISFVSFGIIAILFLVCNELLIEAKQLQGDDPKWWINGTIFLGIYIVILMDHYI